MSAPEVRLSPDGASIPNGRQIGRYLVVLTSDEEVTSQEVEWPAEVAAAVSALCQSVNAKATWSASPRMQLNPIASAAPQGEVA